MTDTGLDVIEVNHVVHTVGDLIEILSKFESKMYLEHPVLVDYYRREGTNTGMAPLSTLGIREAR